MIYVILLTDFSVICEPVKYLSIWIYSVRVDTSQTSTHIFHYDYTQIEPYQQKYGEIIPSELWDMGLIINTFILISVWMDDSSVMAS